MVARVERPKRFCSACGQAVAEAARFCPACGAAVGGDAPGPVCIQCKAPASPDLMRPDGMVDCPWCGGPRAVSRTGGGTAAVRASAAAAQPTYYPRPSREYSGAVAFLCWLVLGPVGLHRFYLGQNVIGLIMLIGNMGLIFFTLGAWLPFALLWWVLELLVLPWSLNMARGRS